MERKLEKSVKQWLGVFIAIVSYYIIHEGTHLLLALILGVFEKIRFVGIWGIQIVTTEGSLNGINLALFSGLSSIVTISIGYILAFHPSIYKIDCQYKCNTLCLCYHEDLCRCFISKTLARSIIYYIYYNIKIILSYSRKIKSFRVKLS